MAHPQNQPDEIESSPKRRVPPLLRKPKAWLVIGAAAVIAVAAIGIVVTNGPEEDDDATDAGSGVASGPVIQDEGIDAPERVPGVLSVPTLGASTPVPEGDWAWASGPGAYSWLFGLGEQYNLSTEDDWFSYFGAGVFDPDGYSDDPPQFNTDDPEARLDASLQFWMASAVAHTVPEAELSEIQYTEVEVDGYSGVLGEARMSWESHPTSDDTYEDTAILLVDIDGLNSFIAIASITQTHAEHYEEAVDALLSTTIDLESMSW